jgi:hypothetical protein
MILWNLFVVWFVFKEISDARGRKLSTAMENETICMTSVVTPNPANGGHLKTGQ